jgi:hypothetical protein
LPATAQWFHLPSDSRQTHSCDNHQGAATAFATMSFCPVDCSSCADVECRAICKLTGERRLDVCEQCGEVLQIETRILICTGCIARSPRARDGSRSTTKVTAR